MTTITFEGGMRFVGQGASGHPVALDAAESVGGADSGPRPVEVMLCALGGCTGMDVVSILRKMKSEPQAMHIEIEHERASEYPKPITRVKLTYVVRGDVAEDKLKRAIELSLSMYCPIANTLSGVTTIESEYRIEPA